MVKDKFGETLEMSIFLVKFLFVFNKFFEQNDKRKKLNLKQLEKFRNQLKLGTVKI